MQNHDMNRDFSGQNKYRSLKYLHFNEAGKTNFDFSAQKMNF